MSTHMCMSTWPLINFSKFFFLRWREKKEQISQVHTISFRNDVPPSDFCTHHQFFFITLIIMNGMTFTPSSYGLLKSYFATEYCIFLWIIAKLWAEKRSSITIICRMWNVNSSILWYFIENIQRECVLNLTEIASSQQRHRWYIISNDSHCSETRRM